MWSQRNITSLCSLPLFFYGFLILLFSGVYAAEEDPLEKAAGLERAANAQNEQNIQDREALDKEEDFAEAILEKEAEEEAAEKEREEKKKGFSLDNALNYSLNKDTAAPGSNAPTHLVISDTAKQSPTRSFTDILQNIIKGLIGISAAVAIFFIIYNAGKLIFALGSSDEISQAKNGLMGAAGGLVLIMFAYLIAKTIISIAFLGQT